ncbi:MAG: SGNH/GDSL hydrolase family protein [Xanthobacteraceae bacterium]
MKTSIAAFISGAIFVSAGFASPAVAGPFDAFYAFGDSTVDGGFWKGALVDGSCGPYASPCDTGDTNFNNKIIGAINDGGTGAPVGVGKMNTEYLADKLGLTSKPVNQTGGTNYAISGSLSNTFNGAGNLNQNTLLPSTASQMAVYLSTHGNVADPNALYLISSGGNDITLSKNTTLFPTPPDQQTFLTNQAMALAKAIQLLQNAGARDIMVNGLQGSGTLPVSFTSMLFSDLTTLGVKFVANDIAGLITQVENNPAAFDPNLLTVLPGIDGDSNTPSACVAGSGATGWGQFCGLDPSPIHAHLRDPNAEQTSL